jgi:tetratricopeptide (TPR) repeat protein
MVTETLAEAPAFDRAIAASNAGQFVEAERLCRQIIAIKPGFVDALHLLAIVQLRQGKEDAALATYDHILSIRPDFAEGQFNSGLLLEKMCRHSEALARYDNVIALLPGFAKAHSNRGNVLDALGRYDEALASHDRAVGLQPTFAVAHYNRGNTLQALGRYEEAVASYDRALALQPGIAQAHSNRGNALQQLRQFAEAVASYDRAVSLLPDYAEAFSNRGGALLELRRFEEALASCEKAIALKPDFADAYSNRSWALLELRRFEEALASCEKAIALKPGYSLAHNNRGWALWELNRLEEAVASYDRAIALKPDLAIAHYNRGTVLRDLGKLQEAQAACLEALRLDPRLTGAHVNLADLKTFKPGDPHLAAMEALARSDGLSQTSRIEIDFALGKAYADLRDYDRSFKHLLAANAGKRATIVYDERAEFAALKRIEAVFTPALIEAKSGSGDPSSMPIFVLGMPRSGTTLVEQIIASHPMVHGAGELPTLGDIARNIRAPDGNTIRYPEFVPTLDPSGVARIGAHYIASVRGLAFKNGHAKAERVTDKMPENFYLAGLIHLALPNAKILHTVRDPVDTCVSCFSKLFLAGQNYTYDLGELGRCYKRYERLMAHWRSVLPAGRILDVRYEDLVADVEAQARRIISHCGLPWDDRCLAFHNTDRPIRTASAVQVRQPIYKSAIGRWRVYQEHLGPLLNALEANAPEVGVAPGRKPAG